MTASRVSDQRMADLTIHLASFYGHLQLDRVNKPVLLFTQSIIQGVDSADITPVTTVIAWMIELLQGECYRMTPPGNDSN